jgi:hypothetical protein
VQVYGQSGLVAQFDVPTSGSGRWWYVFDLNGGTGQITPRNVIQSGQPGSYGEADQSSRQVGAPRACRTGHPSRRRVYLWLIRACFKHPASTIK